ncbi:hypothetical protein DOM21_11565 [Bacteriovorax stolpii]|uniref:Uncharacterized protein n=1 Tax=Bacteriovorax stolpii TaxID=960 RepID=A0A2K9NR11_BACTC|nr:hypothetical protein [Bacteriovorax stolpii]AUN97941.1 hypothetical protein C0V70_07435 [Bacteriovorax stolpii]QDK42073.1 hypothetical protein DOM21_11565 [Bacteriovorax stolpii]TDP51772.1 hypothetical protein C8D79_3219 [Bacteriovorax stolpii]BDT28031.1 hypothetical protein BHI3_14970 [Bacteriovorax sp. HI3]
MLTKWKTSLLTVATVAMLGFTTSCGKNDASNIQIAGVKGPTVTLLQDNMMISAVFENIQMDGGLRYNIPKYKYSFLEISPDVESNGTLMQVSISLKDIVDGGLDQLDPQKLPGGRNLPGVASGSLPAVAFSIEKFHNMSLYVGKDVFGIFLPASVGVEGAIASFRYYIGEKAAGTISLVGADQNGENSGVLLMLNISGQVKSQMMKVYKKYNH